MIKLAFIRHHDLEKFQHLPIVHPLTPSLILQRTAQVTASRHQNIVAIEEMYSKAFEHGTGVD
jgi:hypothetical protein